eukprot:CAMPEP_0179692862 /NCGR_PEP_ID=MMETSP0936-20121108/4968_1 /TAXON_ID=548131 ORGANISM="Ostreococcus mediterraneus, Strain clade-D-RCC2573" /NCGR_SAMPLE_ID=MMETSP0936 /ASSEMBLY_ACC=CAM_ASM_000574 /LENGTH=307 /DNA_ID=CAMNT_0021565589 /DNA_START=2824 /DNA_END=3747 /DNA_ORIENTATION=+
MASRKALRKPQRSSLFLLTLSLLLYTKEHKVKKDASSSIHEHRHGLKLNNYLVLTSAEGYDARVLFVFVRSLRSVYAGDFTLLMPYGAEVATDMTSLTREFSIRLAFVNKVTRYGLRTDRYLAYADECGISYTLCFAADARDVYFQRDPFSGLSHYADLTLSLEDSRIRFTPDTLPICSKGARTECHCRYNRKWIQSCWGSRFVDSLQHQTPICSGTIMGTPQGFRMLRSAMVDLMDSTSKLPLCSARDQGHLNFLYYTNRLRNVTVEARGRGIVNTVGYLTNEVIDSLFDGSVVRNEDGSISAVIH